MRVFVTGGSGQTGPAVVGGLIAAGHSVMALARSDASAAKVAALGAVPYRGSLDELDRLRAAAEAADGVLHLAYGGDFSNLDDMMRRDVNAIEALGEPLEQTGKPLIVTSGTLVMPAGRLSTELDEPDLSGLAAFRVAGERACLALAGRGVRAAVVRLAPTVHGPEDHGFIPMLIATARASGVSAYVGDGANRWPAVHRADAATLFRLALEKAPAGSVLHGVGESAVTMRSIAEVIAAGLGLPAVSLTREEAAGHFVSPFMATVYGHDAPVSSARTQALLGWTPSNPGLLDDLKNGDYL